MTTSSSFRYRIPSTFSQYLSPWVQCHCGFGRVRLHRRVHFSLYLSLCGALCRISKDKFNYIFVYYILSLSPYLPSWAKWILACQRSRNHIYGVATDGIVKKERSKFVSSHRYHSTRLHRFLRLQIFHRQPGRETHDAKGSHCWRHRVLFAPSRNVETIQQIESIECAWLRIDFLSKSTHRRKVMNVFQSNYIIRTNRCRLLGLKIAPPRYEFCEWHWG